MNRIHKAPLTCNHLQWIQTDLRRDLVRLTERRHVHDAIQQRQLRVVEYQTAGVREQRPRAAAEGTSGDRSEVDEGQEEGVEGVVEGLEEGKAQPDALHWHSCNTKGV